MSLWKYPVTWRKLDTIAMDMLSLRGMLLLQGSSEERKDIQGIESIGECRGQGKRKTSKDQLGECRGQEKKRRHPRIK
jgi:hypothetical protein